MDSHTKKKKDYTRAHAHLHLVKIGNEANTKDQAGDEGGGGVVAAYFYT